jgi:competence protein ComEA
VLIQTTAQGCEMKTIKSIVLIFLLSFSNLIYAAQVNINSADVETLASELSGIGQSKAEAIVSYRQQHGPYKQIEDLANVKGIGMSTIEKNKSIIVLE